MHERTRAKLKIISSLAMCLLSLFSLVALTVAWFAQNDTAGAGGLGVLLRTDEYLYGYEFYNIVADETATDYTFTKTDKSSARLGTYGMAKTKYQLLVKVYVSSELDAITLFAGTSTDYFLGDGKHDLLAPTVADPNKPETGTTASGEKYTNVMSSVARIAALTSGVVENGDTCTLAALPNDEVFGHFIDTASDPATISGFGVKSTASEDKITLSADTVAYGDKTAKTFFVIIDYDRLLLSAIFSQNLANALLQGTDTEIPFACDFSLTIRV